MLTYEPGNSILHRLDPRSKLAFQVGFAIAALAYPVPLALLLFTLLVAGSIRLGGLAIWRAVYAYRYALLFLVPAPIIAGLTLGSPWFDPGDAIDTTLASYRAFLIVLLSAAYIHTTSGRESRAAIQRTIPGRVGVFLGVGVAMLMRLFPLLLSDLRTARQAYLARLGSRRSVREQTSHLAISGLEGTVYRAHRLAPALQARCFAWNPTLPRLQFGVLDWVVLSFAVALALTTLL